MTTLYRPIRTLVVDDSDDERYLIRAQLRRVASVRLIGALDDGLEALAYLRGFGHFNDRRLFPYPELMLLDYQMPRCNGMEVLEHLQSQFVRPRIILWSSDPGQIDEPLALNLGADLVCGKPYNCEELELIIHRLQTNVPGDMCLSHCGTRAAAKALPV